MACLPGMVEFVVGQMSGGWMTLPMVPAAADKIKLGQDGPLAECQKSSGQIRGESMSIKGLARDLYKAQQHVHELEKKLATASPQEAEQLNQELNPARRELAMIRRMLDGEMESAHFRKKFDTFGR